MLFLATIMDFFDCISDIVVWTSLYGKEGKENFLIMFSLFMGCGLLMFCAMSYWNVKRIINVLGAPPDLATLTAQTWRREVKSKSQKAGDQVSPVSEGLRCAIEMVGDGKYDPSKAGQEDDVNKFMAAAFEAHKYETTMWHLYALIGLLVFEDLPMAIMSAVLLAETISDSEPTSSDSYDCEDPEVVKLLSDEEKLLREEAIIKKQDEADEEHMFMIIVLGSFTLSCLLLSSKMVAISDLPKQKRMAELIHHESVKLLMKIDTKGPPPDAGTGMMGKIVRRFSRKGPSSADVQQK